MVQEDEGTSHKCPHSGHVGLPPQPGDYKKRNDVGDTEMELLHNNMVLPRMLSLFEGGMKCEELVDAVIHLLQLWSDLCTPWKGRYTLIGNT